MLGFLKRKFHKESNYSFLETEVVDVISEWMWILIIITLLALIVTFVGV
jgi:hypothetical protein